MNPTHAATFAAVLLALLAAHQVGDHWLQTSHQALTKGARGRSGALACARHVASYTAATAVTTLAVWTLFGLAITWPAFLAGQAVSAITHYWADRRFTLAWLARLTGKADYYHGRGGAYQLDQAFHWGWLVIAAVITAA